MADEISENISPYHDPSVFNTLPNEFAEIVRSIGYRHESCIPAIVENYNRDTHQARVIPIVKYRNYDGEDSPRPAMTVTVMRFQHGGFLMDAPVYRGDVGWVIAADRDTQSAKAMNAKIQEKDTLKDKDGRIDYGKGNQGPQSAHNATMHQWSYGFFIPDCWAHIKIADEYKDSMLVQPINRDGRDNGFVAMDHETVITIKKRIKIKVTGAGGKTTEKEVPVTIQIDPRDLGEGPDDEMRIRQATIARAVDVPDGGKVMKSWTGRILCTEGEFGSDAGLGLTYHTGNQSNVKFSESLAGPYSSSLTPKGSHLYVNVFYV